VTRSSDRHECGGSGVPDLMPTKLLPEIGLFLDAPGVPIGWAVGEPMDDLIARTGAASDTALPEKFFGHRSPERTLAHHSRRPRRRSDGSPLSALEPYSQWKPQSKAVFGKQDGG